VHRFCYNRLQRTFGKYSSIRNSLHGASAIFADFHPPHIGVGGAFKTIEAGGMYPACKMPVLADAAGPARKVLIAALSWVGRGI